MNKTDTVLPVDRMESLAQKLEAWAESFSPAEQEAMRRIIDMMIDPWARLYNREGDRLFDRQEFAFLQQLEREK